MSARTCFVQAHHTNIRENDVAPEHYAIGPLRESGIFDRIVLAGADLPENVILRDAASTWGIECFLGSVNDVADRMLQVCRATEAAVLARVLIDWFYVDTDLIGAMVQALESGDLDYMNLPYDFDIKFGADVHSFRGLELLGQYLGAQPGLAEQYRFRPWFLLEQNPISAWSVATYRNVPLYSNEEFFRLREEVAARSPIAWDFGSHFYYHEYIYARDVLSPEDRVLDVACGWGAGTSLLAEHCGTAIGMDRVPRYVRGASRRNRSASAHFIIGDALNVPLPDECIDAVVSIHTMEHVSDDRRFLEEVRRILRPGGRLQIEVPLRMRGPFSGNDEPFMVDHEREYFVHDLEKLLSTYLTVEHGYGVNRGVYCELERARNAAAFTCRRSQ
jgi:SAM-dependent methyltransferase